MLDLALHRVSIALLQPQIAPNTGNIARTCVAAGAALHLVRPFGFVLSDRQLRRSGMDYWDRLTLSVHDENDSFFTAMAATSTALWLFDSAGEVSLWDAPFCEKENSDDVLIFGSESRGIDPAILAANRARTIRIPQVAGERCLNLATSAGIALYEALRRSGARSRRDRTAQAPPDC